MTSIQIATDSICKKNREKEEEDDKRGERQAKRKRKEERERAIASHFLVFGFSFSPPSFRQSTIATSLSAGHASL